MRKSSEINRAIAILRKKGDNRSMVQVMILEKRATEVWVFEHYIREASAEERDEATYCAAREAAQYLSGKLELEELIPDADQYPVSGEDVKEQSVKDKIRVLEKHIADLERVVELLSQKINLTVREDDLGYMTSKEVIDYIGCPVSLMKEWRKKGILPFYMRKGKIYFHRNDIDKSVTIKKYMKTHG